ncbi:MAG: BamA/TamA family outer membrane protein, partial [bacterium]
PDIVTGSVGYNSYWGFSGQTMIALSDIMGNHRFYIYTDFAYSIQNSDFQLTYFYLPRRIDYGLGVFNFRNYYYISETDEWFGDRTYGAMALLSAPFSKFRRLDFSLLWLAIEREYYDFDSFYYYYYVYRPQGIRVLMPTLSLVHDTVLWGYTGPVNGSRSILTVQYSPEIGINTRSFATVMGDYRQYIRLSKRHHFALRLAGGISKGKNPQRFFLGGMDNWAWADYARTDVFDLEDFYFAVVQTPLRGYDYYELSGTKFALANFEFRYPLINQLSLGWPLPVAFRDIRGVLFFDVGSAWDDNRAFRPLSRYRGLPKFDSLRGGYGLGARLNIWYTILRYDIAWQTDLSAESPGQPTHYLSLGAEF